MLKGEDMFGNTNSSVNFILSFTFGLHSQFQLLIWCYLTMNAKIDQDLHLSQTCFQNVLAL